MDGPTTLVRQDAILGGLSIGQPIPQVECFINPHAITVQRDAICDDF